MNETARPSAFRSAVISICAVLASFGLVCAICTRSGAGTSPAVLAAALSVGLMRRAAPLHLRELLVKFISLPLIALAAGLVGLALIKAPPLGAAVFTAGIAISIWLRNFGDRSAAIGRTVALPLMTILVVPVHAGAAAFVVAAGAVAFIATTAATWIAQRLKLVPKERHMQRVRNAREGAKMPVATRMALQMAVALALAFTIGMLLFPTHWPWTVLTAFIVCSGAVGRGDAIYKALLRLAGAIAGTLAAAIVAFVVFPSPQIYAGSVFLVLFFGIWLRQINYVYWAASATLVFALLQGAHGAGALELFALRIAGIITGALCAIAAVWFVLPIHTGQVVRRRLAEALGALREALSAAPGDPNRSEHLAALDHHAEQLRRVAPSVRLHRAIFSRKNSGEHPATLIERVYLLLAHARMPDPDRAGARAEMRDIGAILRGSKDGNQSG